MNRREVFLVTFFAIYAGLTTLLVLAIPKTNSGILWVIWVGCGIAALSVTAFELALFPIWLWLRITGRLHRDRYVDLYISREELQYVASIAPKTAMLMPAHREVSTQEDADAFVARAVDMLCRSPAYVDLFFLFDSPVSEHEKELEVVRRIKAGLAERGRADEQHRVRMQTYRDKPKPLKNKPGSVKLWLDRYVDEYEFMFVLDADSSLAEPGYPLGAARPSTCYPLERLILAMLRHPELSMIQSAIDVHNAPTAWGWFQTSGVGMASKYHGVLFKWLLEGQVPSYGHNNLFRVRDFADHVKNTLEYLSHDFLDAADLITAGKQCVQTYNVTTGEEGEASLLGYLIRDLRWARGNAQWTNYWFAKQGLPLGPRIYIAVGILCYVWPLLASIALLTAVLLVNQGTPLIEASELQYAYVLFGCVVASLAVPKAFGSRSIATFNGTMLIGILIAPSLMFLQGVFFVLGAFGRKWSPRGTRSATLDFDHATRLIRMFAPVSLIGCILWVVFMENVPPSEVGAFLRAHVLLLIASPLIALVFSWPVPDRLVATFQGSRPRADGTSAVSRASAPAA
jgi:membrane glycosyltransferase